MKLSLFTSVLLTGLVAAQQAKLPTCAVCGDDSTLSRLYCVTIT